MNLEEIHQDDSDIIDLDEIENTDLELSEDTPIIKKENKICKKHKCKFSTTAKLTFWVFMLFLGLILGIETIVQACDLTVDISKAIDADDGSLKGIWFLNVTILWIEAIFYLIIISWSAFATTKNGIIVARNRKAKKSAKAQKEPIEINATDKKTKKGKNK